MGVDPNDWKRLQRQADSGNLSLDPEVGRGLDRVCDEHLGRLGALVDRIGTVSAVTGFGGFDSGRVLERKFSSTAAGTEQALDAVLRRHIEAVQAAKEVVATAMANFRARDHDAAVRIAAVSGDGAVSDGRAVSDGGVLSDGGVVSDGRARGAA